MDELIANILNFFNLSVLGILFYSFFAFPDGSVFGDGNDEFMLAVFTRQCGGQL